MKRTLTFEFNFNNDETICLSKINNFDKQNQNCSIQFEVYIINIYLYFFLSIKSYGLREQGCIIYFIRNDSRGRIYEYHDLH